LQGPLDTNVLHGPTIKTGYETPLRGLIDHASHGAGHARDSWTGARILEPQTAKPPAPPTLDQINSVSDIGARVKDARKAMGMTQQRFADLAGVGRRFLIELEHGKHSLEIGRVLAVCQAAGLKIGFAR
jgi:y4mF family transcriptional regulator